VEPPAPGGGAHAGHHLFRREARSGGERDRLASAGSQQLDRSAADVDHEHLHGVASSRKPHRACGPPWRSRRARIRPVARNAACYAPRRPTMQKAGKYEIVRKIGAGGFGVVYEGRDPFIKRRVAIKACTTEDEEIRQRFYREAEIAGNLQHKNIVTIHDFGIEDGVPYLVQEYLTGEDLEHAIARAEPIPLERKLDILIQAAHGLRHAHEAGVIHRDIKPAN